MGNTLRYSEQHSTNTGTVVFDIQCFKDNNNEYIVKEVCVLDVTKGVILLHHVAGPPFDRSACMDKNKRRESHWLTKHYHGLEWGQGDIAYHVLMDKLCECLAQQSTVYMKGEEKKVFVTKNLLPQGEDEVDGYVTSAQTIKVIDMCELGCTALDALHNPMLAANLIRCNNHKKPTHLCALSNCLLLRGWLLTTGHELALCDFCEK